MFKNINKLHLETQYNFGVKFNEFKSEYVKDISHLLNSNTSYVRDNFWHTVYPNAIKIDYNYNII